MKNGGSLSPEGSEMNSEVSASELISYPFKKVHQFRLSELINGGMQRTHATPPSR